MKDKQNYALTPEGLPIVVPSRSFTPSVEQQIFERGLLAAEICQRRQFDVSPENLHAVVGALSLDQAAHLVAMPKFLQALEARGITLEIFPGVSTHQRMALSIYFDSTVRMSHAAKLRAAGVTASVWSGWMRQPQFAAYVKEIGDEVIVNAVPLAQQRMAEAVDAGDQKAIDRVLAWKGGFDYRNPTGADVNALLLQIFEILDEEGVPSGTLKRIAEEIRARTEGTSVRMAPTIAIEESP